MLHKESDESVHEDVQTAQNRLKLLNLPADTSGQMAEDIGFDTSKPMPKPKVTGPDHAEGPGVPLDRGFTKKEMAEMKRADKEISRQMNAKPRNKQKSIENSLLKLMKGDKEIGAKIEDTPTGRAMADTRPGQGVGEAYRRTGGVSRPQDNKLLNPSPQGKYQGRPITPTAHHEVTMPLEDLKNSMEKGHEDPRQGRLKTAPEADTPESEITQGKLPMSEAEERNLGKPERPFRQGWDTGKTYQTSTPDFPGPARPTIYATKGSRPGAWERQSPEWQAKHPQGIPGKPAIGHERINERAAAIENALLKLMKAPLQPGTPPGATVKPNKPIVATPGASGGGTPGSAAGAPGGAANTAPQTNPQVQQPASFQTQHAKRSIQASIDKAFPGGLSEDEWNELERESQLRETVGPRDDLPLTTKVTPTLHDAPYTTQPVPGGKISNIPPELLDDPTKFPKATEQHGPNLEDIKNSLLKLMKAPSGMDATVRQNRRSLHEQGKAKGAAARKGQEETSQRGVGEMTRAGQEAESASARTTGLGADIVGQSIGTAAWVAGLGQQRPPGSPEGFMPDPNTPGDVGANDNQAPPPQGNASGAGETGMKETPKPNTATETASRKLIGSTKNPIDDALGRLKQNP